jgi:hypothetical protein
MKKLSDAIETMTDEELAARVGADPQYVPVMRGARDLNEAREYARQLEGTGTDWKSVPADVPTLERYKELAELPPKDLVEN